MKFSVLKLTVDEPFLDSFLVKKFNSQGLIINIQFLLTVSIHSQSQVMEIIKQNNYWIMSVISNLTALPKFWSSLVSVYKDIIFFSSWEFSDFFFAF